jgi:hypothetical protein
MNFFHAYLLGSSMSYIDIALKQSWVVKYQGSGGLHDALKMISFLLEVNKIVPSIHDEIKQWIENIKNYKYNSKLKQEDENSLKNKIIIWNDRIRNELLSTPAICLYTKGILNYKRLQEGACKFFKREIWERLSITAQEDLNDAAKCLLCELSTPAVMISLRAVEDALRQYYKYKTKQHYYRKSWKAILNELLSTNKTGARKYDVNKTLLALLDYIRENERNVVEHPDKRFEQEEAERIFSEVVKTIIEIYNDMPQQSFWNGTRGK